MREYLKYVSVAVAFAPFKWMLYAERRYDGYLLCVGPLRFALIPYLDVPVDDPRSSSYKAEHSDA